MSWVMRVALRAFAALLLVNLLLQSGAAAQQRRWPQLQLRRAKPDLVTGIQTFAAQHGGGVCTLPDGKLLFTFKGEGCNTRARERAYLGLCSKNTVELSVSPTYHHLYVRVGTRTYDNWPGQPNGVPSCLNVRPWTTSVAGVDRVAALVELPESAMARLRKWIADGVANPRETLGMFRYNGGDPRRPGARKASNCTSWIAYAPIGDNGETLAQMIGVGHGIEPNSFLNAIVKRGNGLVKGVCVFNPTAPPGPDYGFLERARCR
jgi:hypothetical protein